MAQGFVTALMLWLAASSALAAEVKVPAGKAIFDGNCIACHQAEGRGLAGLAPPLNGTLAPVFSNKQSQRYLAAVLIHGLSGRIVVQGQTFVLAMPSQAALSDADLAAVANYVARDLNGNDGTPFTAEDFAAARAAQTSHKELRTLREGLFK